MSGAIEITPEALRALPLPDPDGATDKDGRGRLLLLAGSRRVPGAAVLCGEAALRAGAGKLQMAATEAYARPLALAVPEAMVLEARATGSGELSPLAAPELASLARRADAVVIGPGLLEQGAAALACALLGCAPQTAFLIDAAALTGLSRRSDAAAAAPS
jgi:NAD(P)H-hydrate repair Nnr-like enzyme with NAD(P)H-hydrate dehydratase domain